MLELLQKELEEILKIDDQKSKVEKFQTFLIDNPLTPIARLLGIHFFWDPWIHECSDYKDKIPEEIITKLINFHSKHKQELFNLLSQTFDEFNKKEEQENLAKVMMLWQVLMCSILFAWKKTYNNQEHKEYSSYFNKYDVKYGEYYGKHQEKVKNNCTTSDSVSTLHDVINILIIFRDIRRKLIILRDLREKIINSKHLENKLHDLYIGNSKNFGDALHDLDNQLRHMKTLLEKKTLTIPDEFDKKFFNSFYSMTAEAYGYIKQLGEDPEQSIQNIIENAIKYLKGQGSYSNIKLMVSLDLFGDFLKQLSGHDNWKELLGTFYSLVEKDKELKRTVTQTHSSKSVLEQLGKGSEQNIIENAIKYLKGQGSYSNIKLMINLDLFGDFLRQLSGRDDWKELLGTFYSSVEKDPALKHKVDQARSSNSVEEACKLIDARYEKQIKLKIAEIFKITDKKIREKELTELLKHPPIGRRRCIGFLSGLKLTEVNHVEEIHDVLSKFCDEALSKLSKIEKGSSNYETYCNNLKDQVYEYTEFSVHVLGTSLLEPSSRTLLGSGTAYQNRCDFIIPAYLGYLSELKEKVKKLDPCIIDSIYLSIMDDARSFCSIAARYILTKQCSNVNVIQKVLSGSINFSTLRNNIYKPRYQADYLEEDRETFNKLLNHQINDQTMKSFILAGAMKFLLLSSSNWHDKKAFELVLNAGPLNKMLKEELQNKLIGKIYACKGLRSLDAIESEILQSLEQKSSLEPINLDDDQVLMSFKKTVLDTINLRKVERLYATLGRLIIKINTCKDLKSLEEFEGSLEKIESKINRILAQYPKELTLGPINLDNQVLTSFKQTVLDTFKLALGTIKDVREKIKSDEAEEKYKLLKLNQLYTPSQSLVDQVTKFLQSGNSSASKDVNKERTVLTKTNQVNQTQKSVLEPSTSRAQLTQLKPNGSDTKSEVKQKTLDISTSSSQTVTKQDISSNSANTLTDRDKQASQSKANQVDKTKKGVLSTVMGFFNLGPKKSEKNILFGEMNRETPIQETSNKSDSDKDSSSSQMVTNEKTQAIPNPSEMLESVPPQEESMSFGGMNREISIESANVKDTSTNLANNLTGNKHGTQISQSVVDSSSNDMHIKLEEFLNENDTLITLEQLLNKNANTYHQFIDDAYHDSSKAQGTSNNVPTSNDPTSSSQTVTKSAQRVNETPATGDTDLFKKNNSKPVSKAEKSPKDSPPKDSRRSSERVALPS
jgi:truncated hemoglobin YjbI